VFLAKKWGILIKKGSEGLVFTSLEIPRDYYYTREEIIMFFKKKTSDNEYAVLKNEVMRQYNNLQQTNIVNPHMLRDAWGDLCEKAKTAYKFSKKYIDTEGDIDIFTSIRDEAKEKNKYYMFKAEEVDYISQVLECKNSYEQYEDEMHNVETLNDTVDWYNKWNKLYVDVEKLYRQKGKFENSNYDRSALENVHYGVMYYYGFYLYRLSCEDVYKNRSQELLRKFDCVKEAIKVTDAYKGAEDEFKYQLLRGNIYFSSGDYHYEYLKSLGEEPKQAIDKLLSERYKAYNELRALESAPNDKLPSFFTPVELFVYKGAVNALYSYLLYNKKDYGRAHDFVEREVNKYEFFVKLKMFPADFTNTMKGELLNFKKGVFGWKYTGN
jgi:hypothetical protein